MKRLSQIFPPFNLLLTSISIWMTISFTKDKECEGFIEGIESVFIVFLFIVFLIYTFVKSLTLYDKTKDRNSFLTLFVPLVAIFSILTVNKTKEIILNKMTILYATNSIAPQTKFIRLLNDNSYLLNKPEIEWVCYDRGSYKKNADTIILQSSTKINKQEILILIDNKLFAYKDNKLDIYNYYVIQNMTDSNTSEKKKVTTITQTFEETQDSLRKRLIKSKPNENLKLSILQELYIRGLVNQVNDKIIFNLPFDLHGLDCGAPDCYSTDISFEISSNEPVQFPKTINFNLFEHGCIDQEISTKGVFNLVEESSEYINYFSKKLKSNLIIKKDGQVYYYPHGKTNTISVKTLNKMFENYEFEKENVIVPYRLTIMEKNEYQSFIEI